MLPQQFTFNTTAPCKVASQQAVPQRTQTLTCEYCQQITKIRDSRSQSRQKLMRAKACG